MPALCALVIVVTAIAIVLLGSGFGFELGFKYGLRVSVRAPLQAVVH